MRADKKA